MDASESLVSMDSKFDELSSHIPLIGKRTELIFRERFHDMERKTELEFLKSLWGLGTEEE
jgi:hypothetical protein